jgi:hypothetical protein
MNILFNFKLASWLGGVSGFVNISQHLASYPRNLLAARRTGALWASCLRCFAEKTLSDRDVSRFGTERLPLKSVLGFWLRIFQERFRKALYFVRRRTPKIGAAIVNESIYGRNCLLPNGITSAHMKLKS